MIEKLIGRKIGMPGGEMTDSGRSAWGKAASVTGVLVNALLFACKLLAGVVSGSVAIMADAVNNLSDASSSIISLLGFRLAERPADADHPYGHGRYEYLSGLMVAVMIMVIGVELLKGSVEKILSPTPVRLSGAVVFVLCASMAAKLWLSRFNRRIGLAIGSKALEATAQDSRNDVISTGAVLLSALVCHFTGLMLDGYVGAVVAVVILASGFALVRETIDPMLGTAPTHEFVEEVRRKLESYPGVLGTHDLLVHDYGPGRKFASVHLEMDAREDPMAAHDLIDNIERDFLTERSMHMVIHYDPVATDDPRVAVMKAVIMKIVTDVDARITIHDLRIVPGNTHTNVVFDCVTPFDLAMNQAQLREHICREAKSEYPDYYCVITFEHSYARADG